MRPVAERHVLRAATAANLNQVVFYSELGSAGIYKLESAFDANWPPSGYGNGGGWFGGFLLIFHEILDFRC